MAYDKETLVALTKSYIKSLLESRATEQADWKNAEFRMSLVADIEGMLDPYEYRPSNTNGILRQSVVSCAAHEESGNLILAVGVFLHCINEKEDETGTLLKTSITKKADEAIHALDEVEIFLGEVELEVARARKKFPGRNLTTIAMAEEVGEVAKAVLSESSERVREECIQLACMALRIALDGDFSTDEYRNDKYGLGPIV